MKSKRALTTIIALAIIAFASAIASANGMPSEFKETIHGLFDSHNLFEREVTETENGYTSKTTSKDPQAVKLLQSHVKQMEERLSGGKMVRGWDPAYVEFVRHYEDIEIRIENLENGISITAIGKSQEAIEIARNVSKFIRHGWEEHDKTHATVFGEANSESNSTGKSCCQGAAGDKANCGNGEGDGCSIVDLDQGKTSGQSCCKKGA
jgi:hypothetical protein